MGRSTKKNQRPMAGFSKITFGSDDDVNQGGTSVACKVREEDHAERFGSCG